MPSLNKVFLMGNLTRDPELRYIPGSNSAVCEFGIAINRRFVQAGGQEKDETCFLEIVVWGKQAETSARFLQKGASVFIEGRLVYEQWTERDSQKKRSRIRVNADRIQFLNARRDDAGMAPDGPDDEMRGAPRAPQQNYYRGAPQAMRRQQSYGEPSYNPPATMQPRQGDASSSGGDMGQFENVDDIPF